MVRLTSDSSVHHVNFLSNQNQINLTQWVALVDMEDLEDFVEIEKMVLLDSTNLSLLDSLTILISDNFIVAVLCMCGSVTEKELKISVGELMSGGYPPILFLQDKNKDVVKLKQMLLLNPGEVECSISANTISSKALPEDLFPVCNISTDAGLNMGEKIFFHIIPYINK